MGFKLLYKCEFCDNEIWAIDRPSEYDCSCYIPEEEKYDNVGLEQVMNKIERKARYRHQYKLNGFTWNNIQPYMFMGAFEYYSSRESDHG